MASVIALRQDETPVHTHSHNAWQGAGVGQGVPKNAEPAGVHAWLLTPNLLHHSSHCPVVPSFVPLATIVESTLTQLQARPRLVKWRPTPCMRHHLYRHLH